MIEHIVCFKFKDKLTEQQETELLEALWSFKGNIPGIVEATAGINVTGEVDNRHGYSLGLRVTFTDQEALNQYGPHPVHQKFVKMLDGIIDSVIVIDYPIQAS